MGQTKYSSYKNTGKYKTLSVHQTQVSITESFKNGFYLYMTSKLCNHFVVFFIPMIKMSLKAIGKLKLDIDSRIFMERTDCVSTLV